jgi:ADP-heptose:LPS heptosyltransferase
VAFANPDIGASVGLPQWRDDEHEMARWCRLLDECGIPANRADFALPKPPGDGTCAGATVIHPGAASVARRWPPSRWAEVAQAEQAAGRRVVITGSADEVGVAQAVARLAGLAQDDVMAGRTDVVQLAALIARAGRVLCGDTGVAHLATAFGTSSVVLFGPVAPSEWGPPPGRRQHIALWAGRRGDAHGERVDPGLLQIQAGDVIDAISRLDCVGIPA